MFRQRDLGNDFRLIVQETRNWANLELVQPLQPPEQKDLTHFGRLHDATLTEAKLSLAKKMWRRPLACRIETRLDACLEFLSTTETSVETSLDAARKSARATNLSGVQSIPPAQMAGPEDEFERARR